MSNGESDYIKIGDHEIEMMTKTCEGGCGMQFRVMKGSTHRLARVDCDAVCRGIVPSFKENKERRLKIHRETMRALKKRRDQDELSFLACVEECKLILKKRPSDYKKSIAEKACTVCFLRKDDKERRVRLKGLSTAHFARSVGMDPKILARWIRGERE